jgi:hypothetical protein
MAGYSARQSTYVDGDTILDADSNDEFDVILAAFHETTGHTHDGSTAGDGAPVAAVASGVSITSPVLTTPQINDTSADHQYVFAVSELAADRTVTLPLLAGNDEFVFKDFIQTLTNKTLTAPTINGVVGGTTTSQTITTMTGNVTGNVSGTAATVTGAAQAAITSVGTLTTLTVDDITVNGNTISSAGASTLAITPTAGQVITLDGAVTVDAGVVAGVTSITAGTVTTSGDIELGHASDTTLARSGAGDVTIEGNAVYRAGGTDVPVADGGTGSSTAVLARAALGANSNLVSVQVFTASGTWTKPADVQNVQVEVRGGGGGGGGVSTAAGNLAAGGGGQGGRALEFIDVTGTGSETVTCGAAGAAGANTGGTGGTGGTSSFGSFCSATGGAGGVRQYRHRF